MSDSNYYNDHRVRGRDNKWWESFDEKKMTATVWVDDGDGEIMLTLPVKYEVCGTCDGKGSHVNPSIDCDGLSREDFDADPDFMEEYLSGRYDVPCYECGGNRVVPDVDEERASADDVKRLRDHQQAKAEYAAERRHQQALGY